MSSRMVFPLVTGALNHFIFHGWRGSTRNADSPQGCSNTSTGATQLYDNLHLHNLNNTIAILNGGSATPPT